MVLIRSADGMVAGVVRLADAQIASSADRESFSRPMNRRLEAPSVRLVRKDNESQRS
jgi:hypothetical protein